LLFGRTKPCAEDERWLGGVKPGIPIRSEAVLRIPVMPSPYGGLLGSSIEARIGEIFLVCT
jgi:hypothetical protein